MDSKAIFSACLKQDSSLTHEDVERICHYFREEYLRREEPLIAAGDQYKKIVFIVEGILRIFIIDQRGEEVVKNFIEPETFFAEIESLEKNQYSRIYVSAVTDCHLLTLSPPDARQLVKEFPRWEYLIRAGAMNAMSEMIRKKEFLHIGDSLEQYQHFVTHFPLLVRQVPLKYIASFLRITQSSLSRIRRQIK